MPALPPVGGKGRPTLMAAAAQKEIPGFPVTSSKDK